MSVTVVNVSRRGCLMETAAPLAPGVVAAVRLEGGAPESVETIRVCRSQEKPGAALPFCAGGEFMVLGPASQASIRQRAVSLERDHWSILAGTAENSGTNLTTPKVPGGLEPGMEAVRRGDSGDL
jgi:hypothetical protein